MHKSRPIPATFQPCSIATLAGRKVFINNNLTKEQMQEEKRNRKLVFNRGKIAMGGSFPAY